MKDQQGYVECDGVVVSQAAQKAYEHARLEQEAYIQSMVEEEKNELEYWNTQGMVDLEDCLENTTKRKKTETRIVREWFFSREEEYSVEVVDVGDICYALMKKSPYWRKVILDKPPFLVNAFDEYVIDRLKQFCDYPSAEYWAPMLGRGHEAPQVKYYEQFFDLKGKVLLTLEQYQKLKEWM